MKRALVAMLGLTFASVLLAGPVTVKPVSVSETRIVEIDKGAPSYSGNAGLTLKVRIGGDDVKGATKAGQWKLIEVVDDQGTNLIDKDKDFFRSTWSEIYPGEIDKKDGSFTADVQVSTPARKAAKFNFKGEVTVLAGGEKKEVKVPGAIAMAGKKLDDPVLTQAGLTIEMKPLAVVEGSSTPFEFDVTGDPNALVKITIVTKDGKPAPGNPSWNSDSQTHVLHYTYFVGAKPDDSMGIVVTVVVGQKKVTVPVELKDIPLP